MPFQQLLSSPPVKFHFNVWSAEGCLSLPFNLWGWAQFFAAAAGSYVMPLFRCKPLEEEDEKINKSQKGQLCGLSFVVKFWDGCVFQASPCGFCQRTVTACPTECWPQLWSGIIMIPATSNRIIYPNINATYLPSTQNSTGYSFNLLFYCFIKVAYRYACFYFQDSFMSYEMSPWLHNNHVVDITLPLTLFIQYSFHSSPSPKLLKNVCFALFWMFMSNLVTVWWLITVQPVEFHKHSQRFVSQFSCFFWVFFFFLMHSNQQWLKNLIIKCFLNKLMDALTLPVPIQSRNSFSNLIMLFCQMCFLIY